MNAIPGENSGGAAAPGSRMQEMMNARAAAKGKEKSVLGNSSDKTSL